MTLILSVVPFLCSAATLNASDTSLSDREVFALSLLLLTVIVVDLIAFRAITNVTKDWKKNAVRTITESSKGQSDSVCAKAFELETLRINGLGLDAEKDSDYIEKVMSSNALEGNRAPKDVDHNNEFVHSSNGKAAVKRTESTRKERTRLIDLCIIAVAITFFISS